MGANLASKHWGKCSWVSSLTSHCFAQEEFHDFPNSSTISSGQSTKNASPSFSYWNTEMRVTNYNISPCRENAAPRVFGAVRLNHLCEPCAAQSIVGVTEAGPGAPAAARGPGQRTPWNPVTSATLGGVTGFSVSRVPISLEDVLQDGKTGDLSFCSEMWGPLRVDVVLGSGVQWMWYSQDRSLLDSGAPRIAVQFGEQDSKLPGLALPAQQ